MKKLLLSVAVLLLIILASPAQKSEIFVTNGVAIKGYDPVAFFTESKAVKGKKEFAVGRTNSRKAFKRNGEINCIGRR